MHLREICVSLEESYITISYPLSTFFKEREIEKYIEPEEPEPEPQPEEIPVQGIQLVLNLHHHILHLEIYMVYVVLHV